VVIQVEPTLTPRPGDERVLIDELPIGHPGNYINVTFGYWLQFPAGWYEGFGNRPILFSLSNLNPGNHNRDSMRAEGCLIEIKSSVNIYGFTFEEMTQMMPRSFPNTETFELDGEPAMRVRLSSEANPFDSEDVYVQHDDRLFLLTLDYARTAGGTCLPVWERLLSTWQWFTPEMAVYLNTAYGYSISYPRPWFRFNSRADGVSISNEDPSGATDMVTFAEQAMLVETSVFENPDDLSLRNWLAEQDWAVVLTDDIPLDELVGLRVEREGSSPDIEQVSGYFQGPLGSIYEVTCSYPLDRQEEFRPIANAIIYSFDF